jgi:hypothetical protein
VSTSFLTTAPDAPDLRIAVEVAWGADLTDLTGASWTWDDVTDYVILEHGGGAGGGSGAGSGASGDAQGGSISIDLGRPDFSSETQTTTMVCELDNRDGRFSEGGLSPYWPNIRRGTPVRVRVSPDGGSIWHLRFQGQANGFTPNWPEKTGRWATVTLSASGPLRRINQGTLPAKSVYTTEIPRSASWPNMIAYWPCEGGDGFRDNPPAVPTGGHPVLRLDDAYTPKVANVPSTEAFPLSGPLQSHMKMYTGQRFGEGEDFPTYTSSGVIQLRFLFAVPGALPTHEEIQVDDTVKQFPGIHWQPLFYLHMAGGSIPGWALQINDLGDMRVIGYNSAGSVARTGGAVAWAVSGAPWLCGVTISNSGSSVNVLVRTKDFKTGTNLANTWNFSSTSISGQIVGLEPIAPDCSPAGTGTENVLIAHLSVHTGSEQINTTGVNNLMFGLPGESMAVRLARLCDRHQIYVETLDSAAGATTSITDTMGPQYYDTLTELLRECERTGQGLLYDGLGSGLTYVTKRRRETNANSAATLVLDASEGQLIEPFAPIDDDQLTINHCDVSTRNGTAITYIDTGGPVGAEAIGDYATSFTVNPESDAGLIRYAEWAVGLGTQQGYRYPTVSFALDASPELIDGWLACIPTSRVDVQNIASIRRQHSGETIRLLLEGWHEEIDAFTWRVTANTSSAEPWRVVELAAATGSAGDGICHLQTESSQLNADYTSGTTISVRTNTGLRWITTSEDADSFPFDISVGGVKATVTGITSTTSPQAFTLSAVLPRTFTGSTTAGSPLGTPVEVWRPPVYGL